MKEDLTMRLPGLAEGQVWRTENTYLQIVELGKSLILFKIMSEPGQAALLSRLIRIEALLVYLIACEATLMR
ncbi:MAG TPA: hypothetical protein VNZ22_13140 [Bacillota bacterium]|nr:hypothetical protein [Bacillota bacterium]